MEAMEQELAKPVNTPLTGKPMSTTEKPEKTGRASEAYKQAMLTALRTNFRQVSNVLSEGVDANGGYSYLTFSGVGHKVKVIEELLRM